MFRLLAMLAAVTPALLSAVIPGESCGWFAYKVPEPSTLETVVWRSAGWAMDLLPVALALLALWWPRRFPVLGAAAAATALLLSALTLAVPYTTPCGPMRAEWLFALCPAVVLIACLLARREQPHRPPHRVTAAAWTAVLVITFVRGILATLPVSSGEDVGCMAELKDTLALAHLHLFTAEAVGVWVAVAAAGAVLTGRRAAPAAGLLLLVPALFEPVAQLASSAPHTCAGAAELISLPYLIAAVLAVAGELVPALLVRPR
ncbi:hypothetical protein EDD27_4262 [Nonomuraea polychroma]|uniref:Uncharacterized protein n=1 Tax=Nonomuraea polychroma TaxID=46176 RepID=A0A438M7M5_9ACTN|nr:hypothetical protein [Nonomuraea polychroma]RVX41697.1 hypothetical protein EDD27_4262 [Nonomuraea polychroma]